MTQAVTYERETKSVAFQGKIIVLESLKEILLAVIVSALKFVRRSCSTVAYKAHLLPYVATYPLFRA